MGHMVITIGCEYGSGGPEIGKTIAESLGIAFYDRDLVDKVVEETGIDRNLIEQADVQNNIKFSFDTKFGPRYANLSNRVINHQFRIIQKFAAESPCVIIGRCSDYILKDFDNCLNIFVYAPKENRVETIMRQQNISRKEACGLLEYQDKMLHSRYKYVTGTYRGDRQNRHLLIDSSVLGWDKTTKYILEFIKARFEKE